MKRHDGLSERLIDTGSLLTRC